MTLTERIQTYLETYADHLGRKVTKSSPLTLQTARKRLYFRDFKERLVHFNGTVVTKTKSRKHKYNGKEYKLDVDNDLVPVCPNCHYMLHRSEPPYTIEELKMMLVKDNQFRS